MARWNNFRGGCFAYQLFTSDDLRTNGKIVSQSKCHFLHELNQNVGDKLTARNDECARCWSCIDGLRGEGKKVNLCARCEQLCSVSSTISIAKRVPSAAIEHERKCYSRSDKSHWTGKAKRNADYVDRPLNWMTKLPYIDNYNMMKSGSLSVEEFLFFHPLTRSWISRESPTYALPSSHRKANPLAIVRATNWVLMFAVCFDCEMTYRLIELFPLSLSR